MSELDSVTINLELEHMKETNKEIKDDVKNIKDNMITQDGMNLANEKLCRQILKTIKDDYVSKEEFGPIKRVVYGTVGAVLTAFISVLVYIVFKTP